MFKYKVVLFLLLVQQCSTPDSNNELAFYYWKTQLSFNEQELQLAEKMKVDKFYLRFFDVDWSEMQKQPIPLGGLNINYEAKPPDYFVSCIYITNTVIQKCSNKDLDLLAKRIKKKSEKIAESIDSYAKYARYEYDKMPDSTVIKWNEIQIDCDWTPKTKDKYFYFLEQLKKEMVGKTLSATLRLWQLKYQEKAGIPPVDKVMLMCYSTGNPKEYNIHNSLATYDDIAVYIEGQTYQLPMDFALPIFHWAVLFRDQKFKGLLRDIDLETVKSDTINFAPIDSNRYYFKSDTVIGNTYIRYGDEIRLESLSKPDMSKLIALLKDGKLKTNESTISFFSWDASYLKNYTDEDIWDYYHNITDN